MIKKKFFITVASAYELTIISTGKSIKCMNPKLYSSTLGHEDSHIGHENTTPKMSLCIYITVCYVE